MFKKGKSRVSVRVPSRRFLSALCVSSLFIGSPISGLAATGLKLPVSFEFGAGLTKFSSHGDGVWYQKEAGPYNLKLISPSLSFGIRGNLIQLTPTYGVDYRAGVQYLGHYSTICECLSSDLVYEELLRGAPTNWPLSKFTTSGDSFGTYAIVQPYYLVQGIQLFGQVGGKWIATTNKVEVENWRANVNGDVHQFSDPQFLAVSNGTRWSFAPTYGLGLRWPTKGLSVTLSATRVNAAKGEWYPIIQGNAYNLEVSQEF